MIAAAARLARRPGRRVERRGDRRSCSSSPARSGSSATARPTSLASTSGSATGATGTRAVIDALPDRDTIKAVIVISQPGSVDPVPPLRRRQLDRGVAAARSSSSAPPSARSSAQTRPSPAGGPAAFTQLARLAIPSGLGDAGAADRRRFRRDRDLLGRRAPARGRRRTASRISRAETVDAFGRAVQSTVGALDAPSRRPRARAERPRSRSAATSSRLGAGGCSRWR